VLLWVVVTRTQLTKLVNERNQGKTISMCAMKAGMHRKKAGKYLSQDKVMEQRPVPTPRRFALLLAVPPAIAPQECGASRPPHRPPARSAALITLAILTATTIQARS
jgi:hypothetical protein